MQTEQLDMVVLSAAGHSGIAGTQAWGGNNNFEGTTFHVCSFGVIYVRREI